MCGCGAPEPGGSGPLGANDGGDALPCCSGIVPCASHAPAPCRATSRSACASSADSRTGRARAGTAAGARTPGPLQAAGDRPGDAGCGNPPRHRRIQTGDVAPETCIAPLAFDRPPAPSLPSRDLLQHLLPLGVFAGVPDGAGAQATRPLPCGRGGAVRVQVDGADLQVRLGQPAVSCPALDLDPLLEGQVQPPAIPLVNQRWGLQRPDSRRRSQGLPLPRAGRPGANCPPGTAAKHRFGCRGFGSQAGQSSGARSTAAVTQAMLKGMPIRR